eukprot:scaffold1248_cov393-Prasinococcus_capsulatus_cf.AAC.4
MDSSEGLACGTAPCLQEQGTQRRCHELRRVRSDSSLPFVEHDKALKLLQGDVASFRERSLAEARLLRWEQYSIVRRHFLSFCIYTQHKCQTILNTKWFQPFILICIIASSLVLAVEHPGAPSHVREGTDVTLKVFTGIFLVEMIIKLCALGIRGYVKDRWNWLDGFIVVLSVVSDAFDLAAAGSNINVPYLKSFRTIRVLRPLRTITNVPELKIVVNALLLSFPGLSNMFVFLGLFWLVFGVLGLSLFRGKFRHCVDALGIRVYDVDTKAQCLARSEADGYTWINTRSNFDNIYEAIFTLFEMSTTEGWLDVMHNGIDARGPDLNPMVGHKREAFLFFILFMGIGYFFLINLFIGVIMDNFSKMREEAEQEGRGRNIFLTEQQRAWVNLQSKLINAAPRRDAAPPDNGIRRFAFNLRGAKCYQILRDICVILDVVAMLFWYYGMSSDERVALLALNYVFGGIFIVDYIIMLLGRVTDKWLDNERVANGALIVLMVLLETLLEPGAGRMARVLRVIETVRRIRSIKNLLDTLLLSTPTLLNVGALMMLVFFLYAVLGVQLFGQVFDQQECITPTTNFKTFGNALKTLFRMSTGEGWNCIMGDAALEEFPCSRELGNCGNKYYAWFYFYSFTIIGHFILLNLFVAVVLEHFGKEETIAPKSIKDGDFATFFKQWHRYDVDGDGFIAFHDLNRFLQELPPPLGIGEAVDRSKLLQLHSDYKIKVYTSSSVFYCHYLDVLHSLTAAFYGVSTEDLPPEVKELIESQLARTKSKRLVDSRRQMEKRRRRLNALNDSTSSSLFLETLATDVLQAHEDGEQWNTWSIHRKPSQGRCSGTTTFDLQAATIIQAVARGWIIRAHLRELQSLYSLKDYTADAIHQFRGLHGLGMEVERRTVFIPAV